MNGAGKSTTFKMMTGDISITMGQIFVRGINLKEELPKVRKLMGYCPQFDALMDDLTGAQTLKIFGMMRGYSRGDTESMIKDLASALNLTKYLNVKVKDYSGGSKRKLSTANALLGSPPVVLLGTYFDF